MVNPWYFWYFLLYLAKIHIYFQATSLHNIILVLFLPQFTDTQNTYTSISLINY